MIKTITTIEYLTKSKNPTTPTFCDIETNGLYINTSLIQTLNNGQSYLIRTNTDEEVEAVKKHLKPLHLVFWNAPYDLGTLRMVPEKLDDLWVAFKIAYPSVQNFTLDNCVEYLGYKDLYEGLDKKSLQKQGFVRDAYLSQDQLRYAEADVRALERMWKEPKIQKVIEHNLAYKLAIYAIEEAMIWQNNGLPTIKETVDRYIDSTEFKIQEAQAALDRLVGRGFNPRSPKQVKELLGIGASDKATLTRIIINGELEASVKSSTGRGNNQIAKKFTETEQEIAEKILEARKVKNDLSKLVNYQVPKVYGRFSPVGAATSRWTCKGGDLPDGINLQNYSRDFKTCFGVSKGSGEIIVAADFATLEIRIAAAIMNEPNMYAALMAGEDIHKKTASLIYNKPLDEIHGRERSNAKVANFGLTYGMGKNVFIQYAFDLYGIKFTDAEATELIAKFFKGYPGLKKYHTMVGNSMRKHNYKSQTALGYWMKPKMYAEAINGATQGTGGETMRLAIHLLIKKDKRALDYIVNSIHDAAYMIVPEVDVEYWSKILKDSMQEAWYEISKSSVFHFHDIPMPVDIMTGYNMGDLEEGFAGGGQALSVAEMRETQERNK